MKEYVRAIFTGNGCDSRDRRLRSICNDDWMYEEPILREILVEHQLEEEKIEDALRELYEDDLYRGDGFTICVESFALNELE